VKTTNRHPRSAFHADEDFRLMELVRRLGTNWTEVSRQMKTRNPRQCRERWTNYLSPDICQRPWTDDEDHLLLRKVAEFGAKWVQITAFFPRRTDSSLKNRWFILMRRARKLSPRNDREIQLEPAVPSGTKMEPPPPRTKPVLVDCTKPPDWEGLWFQWE
jgi:hypothetical protein